KRAPLYNTTDYVTLPNADVSYTSNNPLEPSNTTSAPIVTHELIKTQLTANITFGQKYMSYPDGKFNLPESDYPTVSLTMENGMGSSNPDNNFTQLRARVFQNIKMGNKGDFSYQLKGGTFFNGDAISFVDYQHFNGNQTRVGTTPNYTDTFNLLPYYALSTNRTYAVGHAEHDFRGWILGKIPGVNQLNFNLVVGAHVLAIDKLKPYSEFSVGIDNLGIGKYRLLRVDYVRNYFNGSSEGAFIFGLKFLGLFN
ncbi:MAG: hypothetical protein CMC08_03460, partial [Flavobacteriaceae bacterium]|nr:hypothetical protein [Flavobacteriaceae bacterium]